MKWFGREADKQRIRALQEACDSVCATVGVGESMGPLAESFKCFLITVKDIVGDDISFVRTIRSNQVIEEPRLLRFLFDGSGKNRDVYSELFKTSTGERIVLWLMSRPGTGPETTLEAVVGFEGEVSGVTPIVWRAKLSDYSEFMDEMSSRPVLDAGFTRKQAEMASSLVRSRLAHGLGRDRHKDYGLTLAGKAVRVALKWRWLTFPLAIVFALLVIFANVNATLDLVCKLFDSPWCP